MLHDELLIINCRLFSDAAAELLSNQYILIGNGLIEQIGGGKPETIVTRTLDAENMVVMPGLVNGHNHCGMTLFRGMADDLDLDTWLQEKIFPAEKIHMDPETVYWCTKLAAAEMIRSGTTTVADCYFFPDQAARALCDAGLRCVVAHGVMDFPTPSVPNPRKNIEAVASFIETWLNRSPLVTPAVFAHAPYTCSPRTLMEAKQIAHRHRLHLFIHLAERQNEHFRIQESRGATPVKHLLNVGILDARTTGIHAVWVDERDLDILARSEVPIVSCPQSNAKLASGIAPVAEMLSRNIIVGLGTDSCASNNSLDMFREMDMLAKAQKCVTSSSTALSARDALACATYRGAAAIGLTNLGGLRPGCHADLILINTDKAHLCPFYNPDLLVYAAAGSDVDTVIIAGRIVMQRRRLVTIDLEELYDQIYTRLPR